MRRSRRVLIAVVGVSLLALIAPAMPAMAQAPVKIGVLAPVTGVFASFAKDIVDGAQLFNAESGGQLGGRKLELIVEDYQVRPDVAVTKIRKLAEQAHVHAVVGIVLSAAAIAVKDYVNAQKLPLVISGFAVAENLTLQLNPYVFRITYTGNMTGGIIGAWAHRHLKAKKAAIIASDSVGPLEIILAWARGFEEAGGKVVKEVYAPLGTADFAPYVAQLQQLGNGIDVIGVQTVGADGVRFVKQWREYGMQGKIPLVDASVGFSDLSLLPASGEAAVGGYNSQPYQYTLDTPRNKKFVQAFRAKFNRDPGAPAVFTYSALLAIDQAAKTIGGKVEDSARLIEALRKMDLDAPQGRIHFDKLQNVVSDIHISRIDKLGGQIVPTVIETFRNVDQFLGPSPEEYMKKPRLVNLKGTFAK